MSGTPGYLDLQVNGCAGVDFNADDLDAESLRRACRRLHDDGAAGVLATIITDRLDLMADRISRLVRLRDGTPQTKKLIRGIHLEGPFLSDQPGFAGAHPREFVRPADTETTRRLLDAGGGLVRLVTLAPERDAGLKVTRFLADRDVRVAAGHTDASLDQLHAAADAGLTLFTHVGNGCPLTLPRHDNIIQRALSLADRLWLTFIADGVHIPLYALGNYLRCAGPDRAILVSDATAAAGLGPGRYTLGSREVLVGDDEAAWAPDRSHLVGSAAMLSAAIANLTPRLEIPPSQVNLLTSTNPARALGLDEAAVNG